MAWKQATVQDLKLVLSKDEIEKLDEVSSDLSARIQGQLDAVADQFRAAFTSKGYNLDVREHYIDDGYLVPMLNYARWQIWTTFPMTEAYALSEPREKLFEQAVELLKNPYLGTSEPDYSDDPELSGTTGYHLSADPAITIPWLRVVPQWGKFGFPETYWPFHDFQPRKMRT